MPLKHLAGVHRARDASISNLSIDFETQIDGFQATGETAKAWDARISQTSQRPGATTGLIDKLVSKNIAIEALGSLDSLLLA